MLQMKSVKYSKRVQQQDLLPMDELVKNFSKEDTEEE